MEDLAERVWVAAAVLKTVGQRELVSGFESTGLPPNKGSTVK